ncbi:Multiple RNA-binding domain-containing protein 1 [Tulasnella sp. 331]|nr:Multiple RNA-binding domain-containing protein 1 [Tulasnella sp. 331]
MPIGSPGISVPKITSRLIVKNLPHYLTSTRLLEHFDQANLGSVTDVRLASKHDGTSRRFGFVGYKTQEEAWSAKEYFDRSFVDASRIQVEVVDPNISASSSHRPAKRPRLDGPNEAGPSSNRAHTTNANEPTITGTTVEEAVSTAKDEAKEKRHQQQLAEFLAIMGPRSKARAWENEEPDRTQLPRTMSDKQKEKQAVDQMGTLEVVEDKQPKEMSDLEWMRSRMKRKGIQGSERGFEAGKVFEQSDDEGEAKPDEDIHHSPSVESNQPEQTEAQKYASRILATGRLFLRNLTFTVTTEDIKNAFKVFGDIEQVHIPIDMQSHQPKGVAYVRFTDPKHALAAYEAMDGRDLQGRRLHILPAIENRLPAPEDGVERKMTLQQVTSDKRKANASKEFNWAMLYMNSDAVASSVADRLKISKTDILNAESGSTNPAVKLALAETHIINETKKYLEDNGIIQDSFQNSATRLAPRSNTTILVKNIPYGTGVDDLKTMFNMHGEVVRLLLPPAGTMAVVEFEHAMEASKAFKALAYKRLGNAIMYLEWAPTGLFRSEMAEDKAVTSGTKPLATPVKSEAGSSTATDLQDVVTVKPDPVNAASPAGSTLFVKNLNFSTTTERLISAFRGLHGFAFARVNMKPDPKNPQGKLSMGYGFVGFASVEAAQSAMKTTQGLVLDGHALLVSFSGRGTEDEQTNGKGNRKMSELGKSKTAKMIVKNVPFEASKKDIRELFGAYGTLKSVRLPRKFDSKARGFAFLEFMSRHEAENAMVTLKHTHLLGRHLVLDWAAEGEVVDVDALRDKIRKGYVDEGKEIGGRKRKLDMTGGVEDADDGLLDG